MSSEAFNNAMKNKMRQTSSSVGDLLMPTRGYREEMLRHGLTPKNHMSENRRKIKKIEQKFKKHTTEEAETEKEKQILFKMSKFKSVPSRVMKEIKTQTPRKNSKDQDSRISQPFAYLRKNDGRAANKKSPASKIKIVLSPGAVSAASELQQTPIAAHKYRISRKPQVPRHTDLNSLKRDNKNKDFIAVNAVDVINKVHTPTSTHLGAAATSTSAGGKDKSMHKDFGTIPRYLIERKANWAAEEAKKRANLLGSSCPPGMRYLSEAERLEYLESLQMELKTAYETLHQLPLNIVTHSKKLQHKNLESKMKELHEAIKIFSRKKVYVVDDTSDKKN